MKLLRFDDASPTRVERRARPCNFERDRSLLAGTRSYATRSSAAAGVVMRPRRASSGSDTGKDAIIEGLLETLKATAMDTSLYTAARGTPLTDLCQISKEACDAVRAPRGVVLDGRSRRS